MDKTNALRQLDRAKVKYEVIETNMDAQTPAEEVAKHVGINPDILYKTLVTVSKTNKYYVFVLPSNKELDLKKCAKCVGEKSIEMLKSKLLLGLTGYVHGGCSPFNMKKFFPTTIFKDALNHDEILVNAGKVGMMVKLKVADIEKVIRVSFDDFCVD